MVEIIFRTLQTLSCLPKFHKAFKSILRFSAHIEGKIDVITDTNTAQVTQSHGFFNYNWDSTTRDREAAPLQLQCTNEAQQIENSPLNLGDTLTLIFIIWDSLHLCLNRVVPQWSNGKDVS